MQKTKLSAEHICSIFECFLSQNSSNSISQSLIWKTVRKSKNSKELFLPKNDSKIAPQNVFQKTSRFYWILQFSELYISGSTNPTKLVF